MPPDPDFPEDPTFDISHIAGNASPSTKRVLGNVPLFFRNRYPATVKGPIFAESIFPRMKVVEITTDENREPEVVGKKVGRVVVEVVVDDDMLNGGATLHAGCAAALIAMTSTSAIEALISASAGHVINNLSQAVNVIYHSPAEKGDLLRLVNASLTVGARVHSARTEIWNVTRGRLVASGSHVKMVPGSPKANL
ncbi:hypothetical protein DFP72DRAFT_592169 [Ephemerocybe angulata]|uniref:Thioesterase domain-containing protein n=1 Tax=Ephemerocybe angulata TaxID=980116 RepID=A0A8H6ICX8_9AGAR|nr:hypothetical protein DFP72DRAFT_592169 [Tulosesus angulatus]